MNYIRNWALLAVVGLASFAPFSIKADIDQQSEVDRSAQHLLCKKHLCKKHCRKWVGSWGRALGRAWTPAEYIPVPTVFGLIYRDGVTDHTVRLIQHMTTGGKKVRLTLQNLMIDPPTNHTVVTITQVNVAQQASAQAIVPGTNKLVTFNNGEISVQIFPGGSVLSDPIDFEVSNGDNLAVSLYFQGPSFAPPFCLEATGPGPVFAPTTGGYVANDPGNLNSNVTFDVDVSQIVSGPLWLSGIDVYTKCSGKTIAAWGNSITIGTGMTPNTNMSYPDQLAVRLEGTHLGVVNLGYNGNSVTDGSRLDFGVPNPLFGASALNRLGADLLTLPSLKYIIFMEGLNDITSGVRTADQIIDGIAQWIKQVKRARPDIKIYGSPLIPFGSADFWTPALEAIRQKVNVWILNASNFDAIIDFDKAVRDPTNHVIINPPWDSGDGYHPNDAGYGVMAHAINLKLFFEKKAR